jgi:ribosome-binding factor A
MRSVSEGPPPLEEELYPEFEAPPVDRKTRQLCKQVLRVLASVLGGEVADEDLQSLAVEAVEPAPNASRLRVVLLAVGDGPGEDELRERLARIHGFLRAQVAQAIYRERAPELVFEVMRLTGPTP